MGDMKYKVGDRVQIKSLDWYNENKDEYGQVDCGSRFFFAEMSDWCGKIATIKEICKTNCYRLEECYLDWTDEMIEGLVEDEFDLIPKFGEYSDNEPLDIPIMTTEFVKEHGLPCPDGYIFKDENGNVIHATKIVLEKKKKEYPKTYEECCEALEYIPHTDDIIGYKWDILQSLQKLLICRDAYWKIVGEEMGLGKPWKSDWTYNGATKYCIGVSENKIQSFNSGVAQYILAFPTEEMRDTFKKNFDPDIEICKEFL